MGLFNYFKKRQPNESKAHTSIHPSLAKQNIYKTLNTYFNGEVNFPDELNKTNGMIDDMPSGWLIRYCWGKDSEKGLYLDFTAIHRMTNHRHIRILSTGEIEHLRSYQESYSYNPNKKGDKEEQEQKFHKHNRKISKELKGKKLF